MSKNENIIVNTNRKEQLYFYMYTVNLYLTNRIKFGITCDVNRRTLEHNKNDHKVYEFLMLIEFSNEEDCRELEKYLKKMIKIDNNLVIDEKSTESFYNNNGQLKKYKSEIKKYIKTNKIKVNKLYKKNELKDLTDKYYTNANIIDDIFIIGGKINNLFTSK